MTEAAPMAAGVLPPEPNVHESGFGSPSLSRSDSAFSASDFARGELMATAVRMVTPLRREFGRTLDVSHFLDNAAYAMEIIALAISSKDARLRSYATFLQLEMFSVPRSRGR